MRVQNKLAKEKELPLLSDRSKFVYYYSYFRKNNALFDLFCFIINVTCFKQILTELNLMCHLLLPFLRSF